MGRCVSCSADVGALYTRFGEGTIGENVVVNPCPECKRIADPYVQDEPTLLLIDLFLVKPSVYRHLLFNVDIRKTTLARYGLTLLLLNTFFRVWDYRLSSRTWARVERPDVALFAIQFVREAFDLVLCVLLVSGLSRFLAPSRTAAPTRLATLKALLLSLVPSSCILALTLVWEPALGSLPPRLLSPMSRLPADVLASHPRLTSYLPEPLLGRLGQGVGIDMDQLAAPVLKDGLIRGVMRYAGAASGVSVVTPGTRWIDGLALLVCAKGVGSASVELAGRVWRAMMNA